MFGVIDEATAVDLLVRLLIITEVLICLVVIVAIFIAIFNKLNKVMHKGVMTYFIGVTISILLQLYGVSTLVALLVGAIAMTIYVNMNTNELTKIIE